MKKNKSQIEFEKNIRSDRFLQKFCPYSREDIERAMELCISFNKDENWLYDCSQKHPSKSLIEVIKLELPV